MASFGKLNRMCRVFTGIAAINGSLCMSSNEYTSSRIKKTVLYLLIQLDNTKQSAGKK